MARWAVVAILLCSCDPKLRGCPDPIPHFPRQDVAALALVEETEKHAQALLTRALEALDKDDVGQYHDLLAQSLRARGAAGALLIGGPEAAAQTACGRMTTLEQVSAAQRDSRTVISSGTAKAARELLAVLCK